MLARAWPRRQAPHAVSCEDRPNAQRTGRPSNDNSIAENATTDNVENVVLEALKGLRNDMATLRTEMHEQFGDLKQRMLTFERGIGGMKRDTAGVCEDHARQQASIDQLTARVERIERRLELGDGAPAP